MSEYESSDVASWTVSDVLAWLDSVGLGIAKDSFLGM